MAYKKTAMASQTVSPASDDRWRIEEDVRTLERAAEVVCDKARIKSATRMLKQKVKGTEKLVSVLARGKTPSQHPY